MAMDRNETLDRLERALIAGHINRRMFITGAVATGLLLSSTVCLEGFRELGLPVLDDLNGEREITGNGFAYMNQIIKHGRRHSMARAFLYPVLAQENA